MGANDHVSHETMRCLKCGDVDLWEFWDDVGVWRYAGKIGEILGVDPGKSGKCPNCGSTEGKPVADDEYG